MKAFGNQHLVFHVDLVSQPQRTLLSAQIVLLTLACKQDYFFGQVELKKDPRWVGRACQAQPGASKVLTYGL